MLSMKLLRPGESWPDLVDIQNHLEAMDMSEDNFEAVCLPNGISDGSPSVTFRINHPDGRVTLITTSLPLLAGMVAIFKGEGNASFPV